MCLNCENHQLIFNSEDNHTKIITNSIIEAKAITDNFTSDSENNDSVESIQIDSEDSVSENTQRLITPVSSSPALYATFLLQSPTLTVRNGPSTVSGIIGTIPQGVIIETTPAHAGYDRTPTTWSSGFGWARLNNSNNWVAGWHGSGFSNSGHSHLWAAHAGEFQGLISSPTGTANVRSGPGTEFETIRVGSLASLPQGTRINVTHFVARNSLPWSHTVPSRIDTQLWLRIGGVITPTGQNISTNAWVRADLVNGIPATLVRVSSPLLEAPRNISETSVVLSPTLNFRSGAGTHTAIIGQAQIGQLLNATQSQFNRSEDRTWILVSGAWVARENTTLISTFSGRNFHVTANPANIRNAPSVEGTTIVGTIANGTILATTHRLRVTGGMDWFRFNQTINGQNMIGWIADVNGFVEGEVGSPGVPMPQTPNHPYPRIDSRAVSLRNPSYSPGHTSGQFRPFYATRSRDAITQIAIHHTAGPATQTRLDLEPGWRGLGWWNGGYHEMVHANGTVELCYNPEVVTNGVFGHNPHTFHIAYIGHTHPTSAQRESMIRRVNFWRSQFTQSVQVFGHGELVATLCPGIDMNIFRGQLAHGVGGGLFVITSDGFTRAENVRSGPGMHHEVVGNREIGSIVTSHETSVQSTMSGVDSWQRIGTNQWISSIRGSVESQFSGNIRMPQTNMIPARVHRQSMVVNVANSAVRSGPGVVFSESGSRLPLWTDVEVTHLAEPPVAFNSGSSAISSAVTGDWAKIGPSQWVWAGNLVSGR